MIRGVTLAVPGSAEAYSWTDANFVPDTVNTSYVAATNDFAPPKGGTPQKNEAARAKTISALFEQLMYITRDLRAGGIPEPVLTYVLAQIMYESDWMTSKVANWDNNYSGIKWLNKPFQLNATKGLPAGDGSFYAHFASWKDWIQDYKRILSLNSGGTGRPIDATTAKQFVDRLRANKYFQDANYHVGFNAALRKVSDALRWGIAQGEKWKSQYNSGQNTFTYESGPGLVSNEKFDFDRWLKRQENWAKDNPLKAGGIAIILSLALAKIFK